MLSILIPTYNYNIVKLVKNLYQQALEQLIHFEIIVMEDGSTRFLEENRELEKLENCIYVVLEKNIGRSAIRNKLAKEAKYEYLLFLDCDAEISSNSFIAKYLTLCNHENIVLGGRVYDERYLTKENGLIYKYGKLRERNSPEQLRSRNNIMFTTPNFLIPRFVFNYVQFDESIQGYGHEDTIFGIQLKALGFKYILIDNPVVHTGLEKNDLFIEKTKNGIRNLYHLSKNKKYNEINLESRLLRYYSKVSKYKFIVFFSLLFTVASGLLEKNLYSSKPSLTLFDLYKLLYLCKIAHSK